MSLPAAVPRLVLSALGFGAEGIAGGSVAACIQSLIGNVIAGSLFAILQSFGMGGYGVAIVNGMLLIGGVVVATVAAVKAAFGI